MGSNNNNNSANQRMVLVPVWWWLGSLTSLWTIKEKFQNHFIFCNKFYAHHNLQDISSEYLFWDFHDTSCYLVEIVRIRFPSFRALCCRGFFPVANTAFVTFNTFLAVDKILTSGTNTSTSIGIKLDTGVYYLLEWICKYTEAVKTDPTQKCPHSTLRAQQNLFRQAPAQSFTVLNLPR